MKALKNKSDFEIIVDQDVYAQRKQGRLPSIKIAGQVYFIEVHWGLLRPFIDYEKGVITSIPPNIQIEALEKQTNNLGRQMKTFGVATDPEKYYFFYDAAKKDIFPVPRDITSIPPNVFLSEIPKENGLDPYAVARDTGNDIMEHLMRHPPQEKLTARLTPAKDSFLKDLVQKNREAFLKDEGHKPNNNNPKKKL